MAGIFDDVKGRNLSALVKKLSKKPISNFSKNTSNTGNEYRSEFSVDLDYFKVIVGNFSGGGVRNSYYFKVNAQGVTVGSYHGPIAEKEYYDLASRMRKSETAKKANLEKKFRALLNN